MTSDTKQRLIGTSSSSYDVLFYPNFNDSSSCNIKDTNAVLKNTSRITTCIAVGTTGDPNATIYYNGGGALSTNTDYTAPSWGTSFYVGSGVNEKYSDSLIQSIAFYSDAKDATDVASITNLLNQ